MYLLDVARNFMARRTVFCEELSDVDLQSTVKDPDEMFKSRDEVVRQKLLIDAESPAPEEPTFVTEEEIDAAIAMQTPKQRLEYMFVRDMDGTDSVEKQVVMKAPLMLASIVTFSNAVLKGPDAALEFKTRHKATAWPSKLVAQRKFYDYILHKSVGFAFKRGIKVAALASSFTVLQFGISAYLGKSVWWDMGVSCSSIGALYCINRGLKGMVAGGFIGGIPGFLFGIIAFQMKKSLSMTYEDINRGKVKTLLEHQKTFLASMKS